MRAIYILRVLYRIIILTNKVIRYRLYKKIARLNHDKKQLKNQSSNDSTRRDNYTAFNSGKVAKHKYHKVEAYEESMNSCMQQPMLHVSLLQYQKRAAGRKKSHLKKFVRGNCYFPVFNASTLIEASLTLSLLCSTAYAEKLVIPINEEERIQLNISNKSMNRIRISDDRIQEILGVQAGIAVETDKQHNHLFLKVPQGSQEQIELTVITQSGLVQDLLLMPVDQNANPIVLETTRKHRQLSQSTIPDPLIAAPVSQHPNLSYQNIIIRLMKILFTEDYRPENYVFPDRASRLSTNAKFIRGFHEGSFIAEIYEVSNQSEEPLYLQESEFYQNGDCALAINQKVLEKGETARLYVIRKDVR